MTGLITQVDPLHYFCFSLSPIVQNSAVVVDRLSNTLSSSIAPLRNLPVVVIIVVPQPDLPLPSPVPIVIPNVSILKMRVVSSSFVIAAMAFSPALGAPTPTMPQFDSPVPNSPRLDDRDWAEALRSPQIPRSPMVPAVRIAGRRRSIRKSIPSSSSLLLLTSTLSSL